MAHKSPRYCLYREFVDAYMKGHPDMTRCASHHDAQTEWNQIKTNENLVKKKTIEYLDVWNKAGQPELPPPKKTPSKKDGTPKSNARKRMFSSDDDKQNDDPNCHANDVEPVTPINTKRKALIEIDDLESDLLAKEKSWIIRSAEKAAAKKKVLTPESDKAKAPVQESVLNDLKQISERIENLIQVKSMGLLTAENQKKLKKLIDQKQQRTSDLKRLQARQRASTRYRERQKRHIEKLCASNPAVATELAKVFRPTITTTTQMQIEADCPDLLQIIGEIARVGGATDNNTENACLSLDSLKDAIKQRGYEIRKSSLYYRLMPQRALSLDGKKHIVTVPVRLRKMQGIELPPKHEDSHFTAASLKHINDLAGIFGNDCVLYLTQDTKAKVSIGRPSGKGQSPLIMHLDYQMSSVEPQSNSIVPHHQFTPCIYAASIIDETGAIGTAGPTYISVRSAKHDRLTHESHAIDFDRLVKLKEFEKVAHDHLGRVKPIVIMSVDSNGLENNTRYSKTLASAIDKFKKHNLDALVMVSQAPGQALFNVVERRLSPMSHDLAGLILPHDYFGTHLNDIGLTEHAELEKENFKLTGNALAEVWSMNILDEHSVVAEYINPSPIIDEQLKMADSTLALDSVIDQVCAGEEDAPGNQRANQTSSIPTTEIKTECDIDELWCATHVLQTQYIIQIIRCNNTSCCTPWRSNYIQVFPHRFLPPPVPFNRSSSGVKMAEIQSSSATTNSISPFYGNLFQRIQFHGIVINRTKNDLLPFDACCPSLQTKLSSRVCSICKQYIPTAIRLRNHYKIHQQQASDLVDYINKEEDIVVDDDDLNDPYDMSIRSINSTQNGVCLFKDMTDWLRSDFEDDPIIDTKTKSTAATAAAMIRKDKQMAAAAMTTTTIEEEEESMAINQTVTEEEEEIIAITTNQQARTTIEVPNVNYSQTETGIILNALEQLAMLDDSTSSIGNAASQQSWDDIDDLIDNM